MARRAAGEEGRRRLLEAAILQLADEGMRGLTHRKVEQRAGMSQGLAKYYFGNLDGMIEAVLGHMVEREMANVLVLPPEAIATERGEPLRSIDEVPPHLWALIRQAVDALNAQPELTRARFELFLHANGRPELQEIIRRARRQFVDTVGRAIDTKDPEGAARMILALVDGIMLHQLSAPEARVDELTPMFWVLGVAAGMQLPEPVTPPRSGGAIHAERR